MFLFDRFRKKPKDEPTLTGRIVPRVILKLEPLEERVLLQAAPFAIDAAGSALDITLKHEEQVGLKYFVAYNDDGSEFGKKLVADTSSIEITGSAQDDRISLHWTLVGANANSNRIDIDFDGGAGTDEVQGVGWDVTWNVTGTESATLRADCGVLVIVGDLSDVEKLTGRWHEDRFIFGSGVQFAGTIDGGDEQADPNKGDKLLYTSYGQAVTINRGQSSATNLNGNSANAFTNIEEILGSPEIDTLIGADAANTWNITSGDSGNIDGAFTFSSMENLTGGSQADEFVFSDGVDVSGHVNGGGGTDKLNYAAYSTAVRVNRQDSTATGVGSYASIEDVLGGSESDTLIGADAVSTWTIGADDSGNIGGGLAFNSMENLTGGSQADEFVFSDGVGVSGHVNGGGGADKLNYSAYSTAVMVNRQNSTATGVGSYASIEQAVGSLQSDTLVGANVANTWNITNSNSGDMGGVFGFSSMENLTGGSRDDSFKLKGTASVSGTLDGGTHTTWDTLDYSQYTGPITVDLGAANLPGTAGVSNIEKLVGTSGADTLTGRDEANTWTINGANSGAVGDKQFESFENLTGGTGQDTFTVGTAGSVSGTVAGGGNPGDVNLGDKLDYSAWSLDVTVDLSGGTATATGGVTEIENVTGGGGDDVISGNDSQNLVYGGEGDDQLNGRGSGDYIYGGWGADTIDGEGGYDWLIGGPDNDRLSGGDEEDQLIGGIGDDTYEFGPGWGNDTLVENAHEGDDTLDFSVFSDPNGDGSYEDGGMLLLASCNPLKGQDPGDPPPTPNEITFAVERPETMVGANFDLSQAKWAMDAGLGQLAELGDDLTEHEEFADPLPMVADNTSFRGAPVGGLGDGRMYVVHKTDRDTIKLYPDSGSATHIDLIDGRHAGWEHRFTNDEGGGVALHPGVGHRLRQRHDLPSAAWAR